MTQNEMTAKTEDDAAAERFVAEFGAAWAAWDAAAFSKLWDPQGVLHTPVANAPVPADKHEAMIALEKQMLPDFKWRADHWARNGDVVFIAWTCTATINERKVEWSGTDIFVMRDGKIVEEVVHQDTLPLWAALDPSMAREPVIDVSSLEPVPA